MKYIAEGLAQELADHLDDLRETEEVVQAYDGDTLIEKKVESVTDCFTHFDTGLDSFRVTVDGVVYLVSVAVASTR